MEQSIALQKEFESLISQLEQIKSINDLTDSNTKNAKKTIEATAELSKSLNAFKENLSKDYSKKEEALDQVISKFDATMISIKKSFDEEIAQHHNTLKKNNKDNHNQLCELQETLAKQVKDFENQLASSKKTVIAFQESIKRDTTAAIDKNFHSFNEEMKKISNVVEVLIKDNIKEFEDVKIELKKTKQLIIGIGVLLLVSIIVLRFI
ncbi:hypothetical protein [Arenibacter lacus]|uniref:hypothetical protein n=1 Tax=Arenibacter lacus TaxID=2608629 RepID=UPI00123D0D55|nr:hypothetical protein [Arenibacter lacus]